MSCHDGHSQLVCLSSLVKAAKVRNMSWYLPTATFLIGKTGLLPASPISLQFQLFKTLTQSRVALGVDLRPRFEPQQFLGKSQGNCRFIHDMLMIFGQGFDSRNAMILFQLHPDSNGLLILLLVTVEFGQK